MLLFDWLPLGTETNRTKSVESSAQILYASLNSHNFQDKTPNQELNVPFACLFNYPLFEIQILSI